MPINEADNPDRSKAIQQHLKMSDRRQDDAGSVKESYGRAVNSALARYPINGRLDEAARVAFVEGMVGVVAAAVEVSGGRFNGFNFGLLFSDLYEPEGEEQQQRFAAFRERMVTYRQEMYDIPVSSSKSGNRLMMNKSIQHVFLDSTDMIANGVETLEEFRAKTKGRSSKYSQGRELHLMGNLPPQTRVTTLRRASNTYLPPLHR